MIPGMGIRLAGRISEASILVIENDATQMQLVTAMLESIGAGRVACAQSAEDAFSVIGYPEAGPKTHPVDLILMDVVLADSNGIDLYQKLAASPAMALVPIIIITSLSDAETLKDAFDAGAADFITKPIADYELEARVSAALGWRRSMLIRIERENELEKREKELVKVTEVLQQTNERLQLLSTRDALTGIANRRGLNDFLEMEWRRAAREEGSLSLLMIDVDDFKNFNDTHGHQAGDECLWMVALCLKDCLHRGADMVGRYGGEEFLAVLPDTPIEGAMNVAEVMRQSVEEKGIAHTESRTGAGVVTVSVGVACGKPKMAMVSDSLLTAADTALYEAKSQGRNRVVTAPDLVTAA